MQNASPAKTSLEARAVLKTRPPRAVFQLYRRTRDPRLRDALVEHFMPLARRLARRYHSGQEPLEDLVQVANLALVEAVDRYEPARGPAFASFARATIAGTLKRHFRDNVWAAHVPRGMKERALLVNNTARAMRDELGREPRPAMIAERLELDEREVLEALGSYRSLNAQSLDAPVRHNGGEDSPLTLGEKVLGHVEPGYERVRDRTTVRRALRMLSDRERGILRMRFVEERTQADIARRIGVSQMQVSRILAQIYTRLRTICDAAPTPPNMRIAPTA